MNFVEFIDKKNKVVTGNATTAIYLILKNENIINKDIMVPANICYVVVFAIIYSGNRPLFVDIDDRETGNISYKKLKTIVNENRNIGAAIIPHMYGNSYADILHTKELLAKNDILFIEDCASSLGNKINGVWGGSYGDYAIYSFGYSKIIELGYGGLLITDKSIEGLEEDNNKLNKKQNKYDDSLKQWSKIYRILRNTMETDLTKKIFEIVPEALQESLLYKLDKRVEDNVLISIKNYQQIIKEREKKYLLYLDNINLSSSIYPIKYNEGSVYWRFSLLVKKKKQVIIDKLLKDNIPVSDWYPTISSMFFDNNNYRQSDEMEKQIINFPLNISNKEIKKICNIFNTIVTDIGL